jgi:hypothetical protein
MSTKRFPTKTYESYLLLMFSSQAYIGLKFNYSLMPTHAFNTHSDNINNVRLHTFVHGKKLDLKITSKLKGAKLVIS